MKNRKDIVTRPLHIALVAGARPNFMKVAPVYHALIAKKGRMRPLRDGKAADRIAEILLDRIRQAEDLSTP